VEAKSCKKDQPCGNSCISWNKTCHIATPSTPPAASAASSASPNAPSSAAPSGGETVPAIVLCPTAPIGRSNLR
jgi:hypothetical protein